MINVLQTRLLRLRAAQTLWHKVNIDGTNVIKKEQQTCNKLRSYFYAYMFLVMINLMQ